MAQQSMSDLLFEKAPRICENFPSRSSRATATSAIPDAPVARTAGAVGADTATSYGSREIADTPLPTRGRFDFFQFEIQQQI
jgi:hypothetical protein